VLSLSRLTLSPVRLSLKLSLTAQFEIQFECFSLKFNLSVTAQFEIETALSGVTAEVVAPTVMPCALKSALAH
jgi:hypothetical protein